MRVAVVRIAVIRTSVTPATFSSRVTHLARGEVLGEFLDFDFIPFCVGGGEGHDHQRGVVGVVWIDLLFQVSKGLADAVVVVRVAARTEQRQRTKCGYPAWLRIVFNPASVRPLQSFE